MANIPDSDSLPPKEVAEDDTSNSLPRSPEVTAPFDYAESLTNFTKEEGDISFTIALLESRLLGERQLARSLTSWTIHGNKSLREHLKDEGLITEEDSLRTSQIAASVVKRLDERKAEGFDGRGKSWDHACQILGVAQTTVTTAPSEPRATDARYTLLRPFGKGGLGSVWLARDESLNRLVALKEVGEAGAQSSAAEARFRREAEVTGQLEHPNIVPVYQYGRDREREQPFYVMRFVGKKTFLDAISEYHARRNEGLADAVELHRLLSSYLSVCQAIAFAHSRNILHRDLKPENVALGNFGEVIVLDWGLAKRIDEGELSDATGAGGTLSGSSVDDRTTAGQVLGTPLYMSPEQASGRIDSMDERTDVYGLGAILFAILTGYAPHEASQESRSQSARGAELYASIVENPTPKARDTNPDAPLVLEAVCARAMARTPAARYQSAADLAGDIQCWMAGEPVSAFKEKWRVRFLRWVRQRSLLQWCAALLVVTLVTASLILFSARQTKLLADQASMNALQLDGTGLSAQLVSEVQEATEDVRFMAKIPPIQAIIRARSPQNSDNTADAIELSENEETWKEQLQSIFGGLVEANSEYVAVKYLSVPNETSAEQGDEIVRVERNRIDRGYVRTLPQRPLSSEDYDFSPLYKLKAGDIHISEIVSLQLITDKSAEIDTAGEPLTCDLSVPIIDAVSGKLFGAVVITIDVEYLLTQAVIEASGDHVQLADAEGRVLADYRPGDALRGWGAGTSDKLSLSESFLNGLESEHIQYPNADDSNGQYAIRVPLDPARPDRNYILVLEASSATDR